MSGSNQDRVSEGRGRVMSDCGKSKLAVNPCKTATAVGHLATSCQVAWAFVSIVPGQFLLGAPRAVGVTCFFAVRCREVTGGGFDCPWARFGEYICLECIPRGAI